MQKAVVVLAACLVVALGAAVPYMMRYVQELTATPAKSSATSLKFLQHISDTECFCSPSSSDFGTCGFGIPCMPATYGLRPFHAMSRHLYSYYYNYGFKLEDIEKIDFTSENDLSDDDKDIEFQIFNSRSPLAFNMRPYRRILEDLEKATDGGPDISYTLYRTSQDGMIYDTLFAVIGNIKSEVCVQSNLLRAESDIVPPLASNRAGPVLVNNDYPLKTFWVSGADAKRYSAQAVCLFAPQRGWHFFRNKKWYVFVRLMGRKRPIKGGKWAFFFVRGP